MIFTKDAMPLIEQFLAANDAEGEATRMLLAQMKGEIDTGEAISALIDRMTLAHNEKMSIWQRLQSVAIGK